MFHDNVKMNTLVQVMLTGLVISGDSCHTE